MAHLGRRSRALGERPLHASGGLGAVRRHVRQPVRKLRSHLPRHLVDGGGLLGRTGRRGGRALTGWARWARRSWAATSPTGSAGGTPWPSRCSRRPRRCWRFRRLRRSRLMLVLSALAGLTSELYRPASAALLADLCPPERRLTGLRALPPRDQRRLRCRARHGGPLAERSFFLLFVGEAIVLGGLRNRGAPLPARRASRSHRTERASRVSSCVRSAPTGPSSSCSWPLSLTAFVYFQQQGALPLHVVDQGSLVRDLRGADVPERSRGRAARAADDDHHRRHAGVGR